MKKKLIPTLALVAIMAFTSSVPTLAHGHHGGRRTTVRYAVCSIVDCTLTGVHKHSNKTYNSHYYGDGHDYHGFCDVFDCALTGYHEHDGSYHFGHHLGDGHSYHRGYGY